MEVGKRDLKDNLSGYIRRIEAGERVIITAHGRVVAEIVPLLAGRNRQTSRFERMIASGAITPPVEDGDPLEDCPAISLPAGTATVLIGRDRAQG